MNLAIMVLLEINILNKLLFTGTIGECAKFLGVKPYIINNALRKDNMGVFKFIVINDKIE